VDGFFFTADYADLRRFFLFVLFAFCFDLLQDAAVTDCGWKLTDTLSARKICLI
jgi:hypothetical protein